MSGQIRPAGDAALRVDVRPALRHGVAAGICAARLDGVVDVVPGECSVLVRFSPAADIDAAIPRLATVVEAARPEPVDAGEVTVAVRYDGRDLDEVAALTGLTRDDVVRTHLEADFVVAFMGFSPGFGYLDGLPEALHVSRLASPRTRVGAGSVAIAGSRCCIYPRPTPGGWRIIGHTELVLFDPSATPPSALAAGRHVRFIEA